MARSAVSQHTGRGYLTWLALINETHVQRLYAVQGKSLFYEMILNLSGIVISCTGYFVLYEEYCCSIFHSLKLLVVRCRN